MDKMLRRSLVLVILFVGCLLTGGVEAAILEVGPSGYPSIQAAMNAAGHGDTVLVHDGTYFENINFSGKAITVKSVNGAARTIINANGSGRVVNFNSGEGSGSVLDGFTITNGSAVVANGGGIRCENASPTITNCIIIGNWAQYNGGGISCYTSASPTISNCIISGNTSGNGWGGGISVGYSSHPTITNCIISGNQGGLGAAISCDTSCSPTITNCTISGNVGNGIFIYGSSSPSVKNTILWGNTQNQIYFWDPGVSSITLTYSDVDQDGYAESNGNIRQNPLFVNPVNGNFRLQPTSPCVDAATSDGAPLIDIEGNARFDAGWVPNTGAGTYPYYDMGALEYVKRPDAWHTFYGSSTHDYGYGIAIDESGNIYVTGYSDATWNGPAGESPLHAHSGNDDIYVLKLDSSGAYQWHTFYGSSYYGIDIAIDGSGNIYVTGASAQTWNGPAGQSPLHAYGAYDFFVLKLDSSGTYQWHTFYGSSGWDYSFGIAIHGSGNVYVTGGSRASWNGPAGQSPLHAHSGNDDIYVLKLDNSGTYQWHTFYGSGNGDGGKAIAIDSNGSIYVAGTSSQTWNGPAGQSPLHAYGAYDFFVLKLDSSGAYQWHTFYGSGDEEDVRSFAFDGSGNVYVTGYALDPWNGPTGQSPLHAHSGSGGQDIFVLKLDSSGAYQWHTFYGSSGWDYGFGIAIHGNGNLYVAGASAQTWNGPAGQSPLHAHSGNDDIYVLKLDSSGTYQWHTFYGSSGDDNGIDIAIDGSGNIYLTGYSTASWNRPAGQSPLHAHTGNSDSFVLKLSVIIMKLVTEYYNNILDRAPEPGGAEGWADEIERIDSLGIDINEGFIAVGKSFFNSAEYLLMAKTNAAYVEDLYETFLQRLPVQAEIDYWVGYLTTGMSRQIALNYFVYSAEFKLYMEGIFGAGTARPENNLVNDLYRGILNRLPDTAGFNAWIGLMRAAQCAGSAEQIRDLSRQIALAFIQSGEYILRARTNSEYVGDLYDAILRRGALPAEVSGWEALLNAGATREQVLQGFTNSPEFQLRVTEVINAGCL